MILEDKDINKVVRCRVFFDLDVYKLRKGSEDYLKEFYEEIIDKSGRITLVGRADNRGSFKYNDELAQKRAESVKEYLVERLGEDKYSYEIISKGKRAPLYLGKDLNLFYENRSVSIYFEKL